MDEKVLGQMFEQAQAKRDGEMKFTTEEADRFKKAFADPEFRKMFSEYMDEIQDPTHREETEQYISQLETEDKVPEGKQLIRPSPGFVAKTYKFHDAKEEEKDKIFINIVQSDKIAQPTKETTPKGDCWSLPYSLGPPHMEKDKKGDNATCFDCCYHPMALQLGSMNVNFRNMLITTAMDGVEEAYKRQGHKVTLERQFHIVKGLSYKDGQVPTMMVAVSSLENWKQTGASSNESKTKVIGAGSTAISSKDPQALNTDKASVTSVSSVKDTKKKNGPAIKKGFLNSSKSSIYEDKIQTLRPGSKKENHVVISPENEEESRLAKEEEAVSRLLGDLSITDRNDGKTSSVTSKSSNTANTIKNVILPLNESSDEPNSSAAAIAAATSALSEDSKEKNLEMMKAVSSKTRAKSSSSVDASPVPSAIDKLNAKEIEKLPPAVPKVVVKHRDNVSLGDFQGISSSTVSNTRPKELIYEIQLPMVTVPSKIVLDVSERKLCLSYQETYKLDMQLPYKVMDKKGKAAFDKGKKALIVTLPVEQPTASPSTTNAVESAAVSVTELSSTNNAEEDANPVDAPQKRSTRSSNNKKASVEHDRWVNKTQAFETENATLSSTKAESESEKLKREVFEAAEAAKQLAQQQNHQQAQSSAKKQTTKSQVGNVSKSTTAQLDQELLDEEQKGRDFIPSVKFIGRKVGYVFHMGDHGLGYYLDKKQSQNVNVEKEQVGSIVLPTKVWRSIPFEVQETAQAVAFLLQVPNILSETVTVTIQENGQSVAVSFDALSGAIENNNENQVHQNEAETSNVVTYGNVFTFNAASAVDGTSLAVKNESHDVASKNMVLLLSKSVPGAAWQQTTQQISDWLTVSPFKQLENNANSTVTVTAPHSKKVLHKQENDSGPSALAGKTAATAKSLINTMQFSSDLVAELD